jgi:hypothetical protein
MGSASIEYHHQVANDASLFGRFDINVTSLEYNNFDTTSIYNTSPGYSLSNFRLGLQRRVWQTSLFVTNLFDKHAETDLPLSGAADLPTQRRYSLNRPRTIGLDVQVNFR